MHSLRLGRLVAAGLAILLVLALALSDLVFAAFWSAHPMLTAIVSALAIVLLSVAVIEAVLNRRTEKRWRVLAQSALIELGEAAHATWSQLAEALALSAPGGTSPADVWGALTSPSTGPAVRRQVEEALRSRSVRSQLADRLSERYAEGRLIIGRWAVALTASESYAEIFDEHVELYGRVDGLARFLGSGYKQGDPRRLRDRPRREYGSGERGDDDEWFVDNLITTLNIAAHLEDASWDLALRVLPEAWWDQRTSGLASATRARRTG